MAKARNDILWRFLADTKSLEKGNKRAQSGMKKTQKSTAGLTKAAGALGVAFGAGQVVKALGSAIGRAEEMNSLYAITEQVIKQTGNAAQITGEEVKEMASQMAQTTGIDKAVGTEAANILLTFKELKSGVGDTNGTFERAHALTADMATIMGGQATDAAKQLGKALNDPITGLGGLSRAGVQFTDDQKAVIKSLIGMGKTAEAQALILDELESQFGGVAEESADATAIIARSWDEVTEVIGNELLDEIEEIAPTIIEMVKDSIPWIKKWAEELGDTLGPLGDIVAGLKDSGDQALSTGEQFDGFTTAVFGAKDIAVKLLPPLKAAEVSANFVAEAFGFAEDEVHNFDTAASQMPDNVFANTTASALGLAGAMGLIEDTADNAFAAIGRFAGLSPLELLAFIKNKQRTPDPLPPLVPSHTGGTVSGPTGSVQPILAKAGERVTTRNHGGGDGGGIVINVSAGIGDPVAIAEQVRDLLNLYDRTNGSF